jgi:hypothetical protein
MTRGREGDVTLILVFSPQGRRSNKKRKTILLTFLKSLSRCKSGEKRRGITHHFSGSQLGGWDDKKQKGWDDKKQKGWDDRLGENMVLDGFFPPPPDSSPRYYRGSRMTKE